jgi:hypothetical protein
MRGHHAPLEYHRVLLDDPVRIAAWDRAIRAVVRPGDVVLDAGAGTAVLGMLAARAGARVHAVESASIAGLAKAVVMRNGLADRVTVHHADLAELAPPEPVDVVMFDFAGMILNDLGTIDAVRACARWTKPGARFLPARVRVRLAPVGDLRLAELERFDLPMLGLDLAPLAAAARRVPYRVQLDPRALLADPADVATLTPPTLPHTLALATSWTVGRAGRIDGFAAWVVSELVPDVVIDTGPGVITSWGQVFLPVAPRLVEAGELVTARVTVDSEATGIAFRWDGQPSEAPLATVSSPRPTDEALESEGAQRYAAGQFSAALTELLACGHRELSHRLIVACYAQLGQRDQALASLREYESRWGPHPFVTLQ